MLGSTGMCAQTCKNTYRQNKKGNVIPFMTVFCTKGIDCMG